MIAFLEIIYRFLTSKWSPISVMVSAIMVMYYNAMGIKDKIIEMIDLIDAMAFPSLSGSTVNVEPLAFMNYVLPIDLAIAMFTVWLPFFLLCTGYRLIKSHVPTIS